MHILIFKPVCSPSLYKIYKWISNASFFLFPFRRTVVKIQFYVTVGSVLFVSRVCSLMMKVRQITDLNLGGDALIKNMIMCVHFQFES